MSGFHLGSLVAAIALSTASTGEGYRWVDENGGVHFGDQPPVGVIAEPVRPALPPGSGDEQKALQALAEQRAKQEAEQQKQQDQARQQKAQEADRKASCVSSQARLERLQRPRQLEIQPDGSARQLTEEERQARIGNTEKSIADTCAKGL